MAEGAKTNKAISQVLAPQSSPCAPSVRRVGVPVVRPGSQMLASWLRVSVPRTGKAQIQAKDAFQLADGLRKSKGTMRARHD
jgi:hypothetical protein